MLGFITASILRQDEEEEHKDEFVRFEASSRWAGGIALAQELSPDFRARLFGRADL
jgi:hypothetical protein